MSLFPKLTQRFNETPIIVVYGTWWIDSNMYEKEKNFNIVENTGGRVGGSEGFLRQDKKSA